MKRVNRTSKQNSPAVNDVITDAQGRSYPVEVGGAENMTVQVAGAGQTLCVGETFEMIGDIWIVKKVNKTTAWLSPKKKPIPFAVFEPKSKITLKPGLTMIFYGFAKHSIVLKTAHAMHVNLDDYHICLEADCKKPQCCEARAMNTMSDAELAEYQRTKDGLTENIETLADEAAGRLAAALDFGHSKQYIENTVLQQADPDYFARVQALIAPQMLSSVIGHSGECDPED